MRNWTVIKREDDKKTILGNVITSLTADSFVAMRKAAVKFNAGRNYTIGWSLLVKKGTVEDK